MIVIPPIEHDVIVDGRPLQKSCMDFLVTSCMDVLLGTETAVPCRTPTKQRALYIIATRRWVMRDLRGWSEKQVLSFDCQSREQILDQLLIFNGVRMPMREWLLERYVTKSRYESDKNRMVRWYLYGYADNEIITGKEIHPPPIVSRNQCRTVYEWAELLGVSASLLVGRRTQLPDWEVCIEDNPNSLTGFLDAWELADLQLKLDTSAKSRRARVKKSVGNRYTDAAKKAKLNLRIELDQLRTILEIDKYPELASKYPDDYAEYKRLAGKSLEPIRKRVLVLGWRLEIEPRYEIIYAQMHDLDKWLKDLPKCVSLERLQIKFKRLQSDVSLLVSRINNPRVMAVRNERMYDAVVDSIRSMEASVEREYRKIERISRGLTGR